MRDGRGELTLKLKVGDMQTSTTSCGCGCLHDNHMLNILWFTLYKHATLLVVVTILGFTSISKEIKELYVRPPIVVEIEFSFK